MMRFICSLNKAMSALMAAFLILVSSVNFAFACEIPVGGSSSKYLPAPGNVVFEENYPAFSDLNFPNYVWRKDGAEARAIIVAFHGGCLHGRSFDALARSLAQVDYFLVSIDMRGYGKWHFENYGGAENQTYHYEQSEGDIVALLKRVHEVFPGKPVYLLGESLGANMGMLISGKYPQLSDGCILVSTYSRFRMFFQPYMLVHTVQAILLPKSKLNLMPYLKKRLTNSKEAIKAYIQDPFGRRKQAPRELGKSFVFNVRAKKYALQIPDSEAVLFIHGGKDKLCNPNSSFKLYNQMPAGNKEFVFLPTNGHLMVERPDIPAEVLETIVEWLDSQGN